MGTPSELQGNPVGEHLLHAAHPGSTAADCAALVVTLLGSGWTFPSRPPVAQATGSARPPSPGADCAAPEFTLDLLGGGQFNLSDLRRQVVVITLWASACGLCRAEMPATEKVCW